MFCLFTVLWVISLVPVFSEPPSSFLSIDVMTLLGTVHSTILVPVTLLSYCTFKWHSLIMCEEWSTDFSSVYRNSAKDETTKLSQLLFTLTTLWLILVEVYYILIHDSPDITYVISLKFDRKSVCRTLVHHCLTLLFFLFLSILVVKLSQMGLDMDKHRRRTCNRKNTELFDRRKHWILLLYNFFHLEITPMISLFFKCKERPLLSL